MYYALPYKTKQFFFVLIKLSIVVGASYYIYNRLVNNGELDFRVFVDFLSKNEVFSPKNLFLLLFLTVFNWFFEILKWQVLVKSIKNISFLEATKQSLGALTASLFTPNRIGEYGAKAIYFTRRFRKRILLLNLIGNMTQMSITLVFGLIGLFYFVSTYDIEISFHRISRFGLYILIIGALAVIGVSKSKFRIKGFSTERIFSFIKSIPNRGKFLTILYSVIRYLIFSFQFYLLLSFFTQDLSYIKAMIGISSMYLLSSVIPTLFILDVIVKGSIAVYIFGFLGINELTILCIVTLMWLFNFVLPSIFGSFHVLNFNFINEEDE